MLIISEERLALQQGIYDDVLSDILPVVKAKCTGVARIIVVKRKLTLTETEFTWIFKGTNKETQICSTFTIEGIK